MCSQTDPHLSRERFASASGTRPVSVGDVVERRVAAVGVVHVGAGVAAEQLAPVLAHATPLHVRVVVFVHRCDLGTELLRIQTCAEHQLQRMKFGAIF
jgi:hypothetical protein